MLLLKIPIVSSILASRMTEQKRVSSPAAVCVGKARFYLSHGKCLRPARLGVFSHVRPHLTIRVGILMMHPVGVHNGKNAAFERDLFTFQPERIA